MDLLVIGWDGATKRHLNRFNLPYWESLSHSGQLYPENPFHHASYISSANAWTTMTTGASFEQHRILGFVYGKYTGHRLMGPLSSIATNQAVPEFLRRVLVSEGIGRLATDEGRVGRKKSHIQSTDIPFKRVWELLPGSSQVFGVPLTYPTRETDGVLMAGIPAPRSEEATEPLVHPPETMDLIYDGTHSGYYVDMDSPVNNDSIAESVYADEHLTKSETIAEKYLSVYEQNGFDPSFGFLMLRSIDDVLHATLDEEIIEDVYQRIDAITQQLVDRIDPDEVLILSDHGMAETSMFRIDKDLRMDHDTSQGIWGSTTDFGLTSQLDVAPSILEHFGIDDSIPVERTGREMAGGIDNDAVHERLKDLGYA